MPLILLCLALSISCRARSPIVELKDELETVASWAATAQMVGEEWAGDAIPEAYARRTLRSASETLEQETATINGLTAIRQELRTQWLDRMEELKQSLLRMQQGIDEGNRARVEEETGKLKASHQQLQATLQRLKEGQQ